MGPDIQPESSSNSDLPISLRPVSVDSSNLDTQILIGNMDEFNAEFLSNPVSSSLRRTVTSCSKDFNRLKGNQILDIPITMHLGSASQRSIIAQLTYFTKFRETFTPHVLLIIDPTTNQIKLDRIDQLTNLENQEIWIDLHCTQSVDSQLIVNNSFQLSFNTLSVLVCCWIYQSNEIVHEI